MIIPLTFTAFNGFTSESPMPPLHSHQQVNVFVFRLNHTQFVLCCLLPATTIQPLAMLRTSSENSNSITFVEIMSYLFPLCNCNHIYLN